MQMLSSILRRNLPIVFGILLVGTIVVCPQDESLDLKNEVVTPEVIKAREAINKVLVDSGILFKEGLIAYEDGRMSDAGEKFNRSVEFFLNSSLNIQREQNLQACYDQLIETVYLLEFPDRGHLPRIKDLSVTCKWNNIDNGLADRIRSRLKTATGKPAELPSNTTVAASAVGQSNLINSGFNTQKIEASPLDELSQLKLTADEQQIEKTPPTTTSYSRPTKVPPLAPSNVRMVKTKKGETVAKIAERNRVNATDLAKYNGLLPNSVLPEGREIRIPSISKGKIEYLRPIPIQRSCKNSKSPIVQKLRLGLTVLEVSQILRRKVVLQKNAFSIYDTFSTQILNVRGLNALYLSFFKNKLFWIHVIYDKSIDWIGVDEFQKAISKSLNLPQYWMSGLSSKERKLQCDGFDLNISESVTKNYELLLVDTNAITKMSSDWRIKQEIKINDQNKKKAEFKP